MSKATNVSNVTKATNNVSNVTREIHSLLLYMKSSYEPFDAKRGNDYFAVAYYVTKTGNECGKTFEGIR